MPGRWATVDSSAAESSYKVRGSYSGNTLAFQANAESSILLPRSKDSNMKNIPGWTSTVELSILQDLASAVPEGGSILEIGCFLGRSTAALYAGKLDSVALDVVDLFDVKIPGYSPHNSFNTIQGDATMLETAKLIATETNSWLDSFKFCVGDIADNINIFKMSSKDFVLNKHYDLIFIDADHSYEGVMHDIFKFSNDKSLIVGDDFIERHPGVSRAVSQFRNNRSIVVPKNTKFYIMIPSVKQHWGQIVQKYI